MGQGDGWAEIDGALERTFEFDDFVASIRFVNALADLAEEHNHHPDIAISWNHVTVRWWTHVTGTITETDVEMAGRTDALTG